VLEITREEAEQYNLIYSDNDTPAEYLVNGFVGSELWPRIFTANYDSIEWSWGNTARDRIWGN
jgi:hypothetical protein